MALKSDRSDDAIESSSACTAVPCPCRRRAQSASDSSKLTSFNADIAQAAELRHSTCTKPRQLGHTQARCRDAPGSAYLEVRCVPNGVRGGAKQPATEGRPIRKRKALCGSDAQTHDCMQGSSHSRLLSALSNYAESAGTAVCVRARVLRFGAIGRDRALWP